MPLREALPPCRGQRAHHARTDRDGTWDISRLTSHMSTCWPASGRRGAVADDARTREVGRGHSSWEAGERSGAICGGGGGAKGRGQGECEPDRHVPTLGRESVTQGLERIRQRARDRKKEKFTALLHHISVEHLEASFCELKENAAAGV